MTKPHCTHFDPEALLHDMFDSRAALRSVLQTFAPWQQDALMQLRAAAQARDLSHLARVAHTVRGSLSQFRAHASVTQARALEARCRGLETPEGTNRPVTELVTDLSTELEALGMEIDAYLAADES